jgi:hypothetical protein
VAEWPIATILKSSLPRISIPRRPTKTCLSVRPCDETPPRRYCRSCRQKARAIGLKRVTKRVILSIAIFVESKGATNALRGYPDACATSQFSTVSTFPRACRTQRGQNRKALVSWEIGSSFSGMSSTEPIRRDGARVRRDSSRVRQYERFSRPRRQRRGVFSFGTSLAKASHRPRYGASIAFTGANVR